MVMWCTRLRLLLVLIAAAVAAVVVVVVPVLVLVLPLARGLELAVTRAFTPGLLLGALTLPKCAAGRLEASMLLSRSIAQPVCGASSCGRGKMRYAQLPQFASGV